MLSMTKSERFLRGFSVVDSSAVGFLDLLKTLKTQRQQSLFLYKTDFHWQNNALLWVISKLMVFLIKEEMHRRMFSSLRKAKKKILREVSLLARCLMLNWSQRYTFMHATKTCNLSVFFLRFLESFPGKIYKKYSIGNEVWLESQTGTITSDYVLHNHLSIS